ncbi:uncharacterized protein GGS25DRAFT_31040 [Hypoxylon fragiforme]|uniref:uncharacterized protein n=1 Tax=Hypoxylon fragiforme TaxID=63214 RepID=UPI0020C5BAB8|nr:uncharacterized protein GGS25DRAFT_31040 [Hypoxylon fragiforme]KAI2614039.1 hypothetical protein GGS25DRAFT_31040 [Hypoxylon fragiforme]
MVFIHPPFFSQGSRWYWLMSVVANVVEPSTACSAALDFTSWLTVVKDCRRNLYNMFMMLTQFFFTNFNVCYKIDHSFYAQESARGRLRIYLYNVSRDEKFTYLALLLRSNPALPRFDELIRSFNQL